MKNIDAYDVLTEKHLLFQTTYELSDSVPDDYVISQTPSPGNTAKPGNTVNICISKGSKPQYTEYETQPIPEISNYLCYRSVVSNSCRVDSGNKISNTIT